MHPLKIEVESVFVSFFIKFMRDFYQLWLYLVENYPTLAQWR